MAPADRYGYALLPTDDISAAGGPSVPEPHVARDSQRDLKISNAASSYFQQRGDTNAGAEDEIVDIKAFARQKHDDRYEIGVRYDHSVPYYILHPHQRKVQIWNILLGAFLLVDVVYLPLTMAFGDSMDGHLMSCMSILTYLIFGSDMVLQFFLQVPSPTGEYWLFNHRQIVIMYLRGNFFIDLVSIVPFGKVYSALVGAPDSSVILALRMLRLVKLLRLTRLYRIVQKYKYSISISSMARALLQSSATIVLFLHMVACAWCTVGIYQQGSNWLSVLLELKPEDSEGFVVDGKVNGAGMYVMALYFSLYTLTGIGYGDIVPQTFFEYCLSILFMFCSAFLWGSVLGEIVNVLQTASLDEVAYQRNMDTVLDMCKAHRVKPELQRQLQNYLRQSRSVTHSTFVQEHIMTKMNPELALQLNYSINHNWLDNVWWLKSIARTVFAVRLTIAFESVLHCPEEKIRHRDRLYVINRGVCIHGGQVLTKDKVWGQDMLLVQDHLRKIHGTVTISYLHATFLTREALMQVAGDFPDEQLHLRRAYRKLCVIRGVIYAAKQAKREEEDAGTQNTNKRMSLVSMLRGRNTIIPGKDAAGGGGFIACMGAPAVERITAQSTALSPTEAAIQQTKEIMLDLESELTSRLEQVGSQVSQALRLLSEMQGGPPAEGQPTAS